MQVNDTKDTIVASPKGTPVQPVVPLPPSAVSSVGTAEKRGKGQDARRDPGTNSRFRAVLDASTFTGLAQTSSDTAAAATTSTPKSTPTPRTPSNSLEISGEESEQLYRASRAFSANSNSSTSRSDTEAAPDFQPSVAVSRQALTATRLYAESFFAVDRTYAARGASLELSA